MSKRREIHGQVVRTWPYGVTVHFRRRIAAWRKRGFSEVEIRTMAHYLRRIGPGYQGPSRGPDEHAGSNGHPGHAPPDDPRARTKPEKHHSRYRAKRGGA